jgi:glycine cleavage system pyridoxal-binding protein P
MAGAHQVGASVLDRADEVAEALVLHARHTRERQLAGGQEAGHPHGVTAIGLDPIP